MPINNDSFSTPPYLASPKYVLWKITMACNFKCFHCGFSCSTGKPDQLTTEEALGLCDQITALQVPYVLLSGGEPMLRPDWLKIASRLSAGGCSVILCTNASLISPSSFEAFRQAGICSLSISLDGEKQVHDKIRSKGSFDKVIRAFRLARENNFNFGVITTVHKQNLDQLDKIFDRLLEISPSQWKIQLADGVGNMAQNRSFMISPEEVEPLADKILGYMQRAKGKFDINIGDNIGYCTRKSLKLAQGRSPGCHAGLIVVGIESNGDVKGCPTLPPEYTEGNIRQTSLARIWRNKTGFAYNRHFRPSDLAGYCGQCEHNQSCRGGCLISRIGATGGTYDNLYCLHRLKHLI